MVLLCSWTLPELLSLKRDTRRVPLYRRGARDAQGDEMHVIAERVKLFFQNGISCCTATAEAFAPCRVGRCRPLVARSPRRRSGDRSVTSTASSIGDASLLLLPLFRQLQDEAGRLQLLERVPSVALFCLPPRAVEGQGGG